MGAPMTLSLSDLFGGDDDELGLNPYAGMSFVKKPLVSKAAMDAASRAIIKSPSYKMAPVLTAKSLGAAMKKSGMGLAAPEAKFLTAAESKAYLAKPASDAKLRALRDFAAHNVGKQALTPVPTRITGSVPGAMRATPAGSAVMRNMVASGPLGGTAGLLLMKRVADMLHHAATQRTATSEHKTLNATRDYRRDVLGRLHRIRYPDAENEELGFTFGGSGKVSGGLSGAINLAKANALAKAQAITGTTVAAPTASRTTMAQKVGNIFGDTLDLIKRAQATGAARTASAARSSGVRAGTVPVQLPCPSGGVRDIYGMVRRAAEQRLATFEHEQRRATQLYRKDVLRKLGRIEGGHEQFAPTVVQDDVIAAELAPISQLATILPKTTVKIRVLPATLPKVTKPVVVRKVSMVSRFSTPAYAKAVAAAMAKKGGVYGGPRKPAVKTPVTRLVTRDPRAKADALSAAIAASMAKAPAAKQPYMRYRPKPMYAAGSAYAGRPVTSSTGA